MITGVHAMLYAHNVDAARAFVRDVLGFPSVDAGRGWLIFALPPAEYAMHPTDGPADPVRHELYFMCDDIEATVADLKRKGVEFTSPISDQGWGLVTSFKFPGAADMGLYQPRHPTAIAKK